MCILWVPYNQLVVFVRLYSNTYALFHLSLLPPSVSDRLINFPNIV